MSILEQKVDALMRLCVSENDRDQDRIREEIRQYLIHFDPGKPDPEHEIRRILLELGAVDAVNLDGGGSTTFITCPEAGKYNVLNSPSDGSLRPVYNSLVVVKKQ
jgi:hypothetical protein